MPTDPSPPRRKPNILWWIAAAFALLFGLFCYQLFGPNPRLVVSKQTTYITTPLRADGSPDYVGYVLEQLRADVTPENNAAVPMWQAFGPGRGRRAISAADWRLLSAELKLPPPGNPPNYLTPMYSRENLAKLFRWLEEHSPDWKRAPVEDPNALEELRMTQQDLDVDEVICGAMDAPWRAEQLPPLADWIAANERQLNLLVEASKRETFYSPAPEMLNPASDSTIAVGLGRIQQAREIARMLKLRAMLRLGEGQPELAWRDLLAVHRWGRLVGQNMMVVEQLVAIAISGIAREGTLSLLGDERVSPELARQIQHDLAALGPPSRMADAFDAGERLYILAAIVMASRTGPGALIQSIYWNNPDEPRHPLDFVAFDWNVPLVEANRYYDRFGAAFRTPDHRARAKAFQQITRDIQQSSADFQSPGAWAAGAVNPQRRSEMLAAAVISSLTPAFDSCLEAEERANSQSALVQIAAALAIYRADNETYPESLAALVPAILPALPVDQYNAKPFAYRRDGDGYLLYTLGYNGVDDGGSNEMMSMLAGRDISELPESERDAAEVKIPDGADDIAIRVPTPAFVLPKPPAE